MIRKSPIFGALPFYFATELNTEVRFGFVLQSQ